MNTLNLGGNGVVSTSKSHNDSYFCEGGLIMFTLIFLFLALIVLAVMVLIGVYCWKFLLVLFCLAMIDYITFRIIGHLLFD